MLVAVLLTATKWGRAWPVWSGSFGALLGRLLNILYCTCPYISRCLANYETLHLTLFGEFRIPTSHAVWRMHLFLFAFHFSLFAPLVLAAIPRCLILLIHVSLCHMSHDVWHESSDRGVDFSFSSTPRFSPHRVGGSHGPEGAGGPSSASAARFRCRQQRRHRVRRVARQCAKSAGDSAAQGQ